MSERALVRPASPRHASRFHLILLFVYLALALILTYPLALHPGTHIPGHDTDGPAQTWSLWWVPFALFNRQALPFSTDYLFYPLGINLVAYTPTFLNGIISIPLQFVFGTIVAQNLIVFLSLAASAYGAFLLAREVLARAGRSSDFAAALAGAVYGLGAWHLNYVVAGHFMLISNEWIPFYALFLLRSDKSIKSGVLAGLFLVLTAWTELTFVPFLALLTAFYVLYLMGLSLRAKRGNPPSASLRAEGSAPPSLSLRAKRGNLQPVSSRRTVGTFKNLVILTLIGLIGIAPLAWSLLADLQRYGYYLTSGVGRIQIFSAEPISFLLPSGQNPLLGAWASGITRANTSYAFIGWAVLLLAALGLWWARGWALARFWAIAALCFAVLMLGTTLIVADQNTGIPMPFALLRAVPLVNANRYPVRFNVMLMLSLAPLAALGTAQLARAPRGRAVLAAACALLVVEQLVVPIPLTDVTVPPVFSEIARERGDFTVLELPLGWRGSVAMQGKTDDVAQFYQTVDQKRRLGGITSRVPNFKLQYYREAPFLRSLIALEEGRAPDDAARASERQAAAELARFFDIRYVSVNRAETPPAALDYIQATLPLTAVAQDESRTVYRVDLPPATRAEIHAAQETASVYFDDGWGRPQEDNTGTGYRWSTAPDAHLWLPLGDGAYSVRFTLRGASADQRVTLWVNDTIVTGWTVSERWGEYTAGIPHGVLREGLDDVVLATGVTLLTRAAPDDRIIGGTGVTSPVDICATGAGFDAGRFGEIFVAGQSVVPGTRGYQLAAIDPVTGAVEAVGSFDTFGDPDASRRLSQFVQGLPDGEIVAGVAIDDVSRALTKEAVDALRALGVAHDGRGQFRAGHAFVGVKGAAAGQAVEDVNARLPANVAIGKNVRAPQVSLALADLVFEQVAP